MEQQSATIPTNLKVWFIEQSHKPLTHSTFEEWKRRGQQLCYEVAYADGHQEASEAMYMRLAPEIEAIKAERDAYRKALEEIRRINRKYYHELGEKENRMANHLYNIACEAWEQYPSPKTTDNV